MHEITPIIPIETPPARIISRPSAEKLAQLYLPVRLRDFYLGLHPIMQCYLYDISTTPEEFFTIVMMEDVRFGNHCRFSNKSDPSWNYQPDIQLMDTKQLYLIEHKDENKDP